MNKKIIITLGTIVLLLLGLLIFALNLNNTSGKMLPSPPESEAESQMLLDMAEKTLSQAQESLIQAKATDLSNQGFFDKIFTKYLIWKMNKKIDDAKENFESAKQTHENKDYYAVSSLSYSVMDDSNYAKHNLDKIIAGKTKSKWTKIDSVEVDSEGNIIN